MLVREVVVGGVGGGGAGGVSGGEWRFSLAKKIVPLLLGEMVCSLFFFILIPFSHLVLSSP